MMSSKQLENIYIKNSQLTSDALVKLVATELSGGETVDATDPPCNRSKL